jgi:hypothetical protein
VVVLNQFYPWREVGLDRWDNTDPHIIHRNSLDKEDFHKSVVGVMTMRIAASVYFNPNDPVKRDEHGDVKVQFVMIDPVMADAANLQSALEKIADIPVFASVDLGTLVCTRNAEQILAGNLGANFCKDPKRREKYTMRGFRFDN